MTHDEIMATFRARLAGLAEDHPLLEGFRAILGELHDDAAKTSGTLGLSGDDRAFLDGRQSLAQDAMERLAVEWQQAHAAPIEQS